MAYLNGQRVATSAIGLEGDPALVLNTEIDGGSTAPTVNATLTTNLNNFNRTPKANEYFIALYGTGYSNSVFDTTYLIYCMILSLDTTTATFKIVQVNSTKGVKGDKGDKGDTGDKGDKGDDSDVSQDGNNTFTGNNTFQQPITITDLISSQTKIDIKLNGSSGTNVARLVMNNGILSLLPLIAGELGSTSNMWSNAWVNGKVGKSTAYIDFTTSGKIDFVSASFSITFNGTAIKTFTSFSNTVDLGASDALWKTIYATSISNGTKTISIANLIQSSDLATVATTGSYNDLTGKPTIPTVVQVYDGTSANAMSGVAIEGVFAPALTRITNIEATLSGLETLLASI